MRVGVLIRDRDQVSLRVYREHIVARLPDHGIAAVPFGRRGPLPGGCDVTWDPGLGMRRVPSILRRVDGPLVVTCHGARTFSLDPREIAPTWRHLLRERIRRRLVARSWRTLAGRADAVIAVSHFAAAEVAGAFGLPAGKVRAIHHGYDRTIFTPAPPQPPPPARPYLLHVSSGGPVKNVVRLLEAYATLPPGERPDLVLVIARDRPPRQARGMAGVRVIDRAVEPSRLAELYRGAAGFVFPSLRESFGLPIVEAMACGCPVITSDGSACAEVAADAALLVDPRSVDALAAAMRTLYTDSSLRQSVVEKGLRRAGSFSWDASAAAHAEVFRQAAGKP